MFHNLSKQQNWHWIWNSAKLFYLDKIFERSQHQKGFEQNGKMCKLLFSINISTFYWKMIEHTMLTIVSFYSQLKSVIIKHNVQIFNWCFKGFTQWYRYLIIMAVPRDAFTRVVYSSYIYKIDNFTIILTFLYSKHFVTMET